jgi:hypothetical protein
MINKLKISIFFLLTIMFLTNIFSFLETTAETQDIRFTAANPEHCGNNICEYNLGENVLNCPIDCFLS